MRFESRSASSVPRPGWRASRSGSSTPYDDASKRLAPMLIFALTLFLSSALLFVVEPMLAKMVLPLLGSTPAVWITSVLFFQVFLLAGYAYAHATTDWLGARRQAVVHGVALLLPFVV